MSDDEIEITKAPTEEPTEDPEQTKDDDEAQEDEPSSKRKRKRKRKKKANSNSEETAGGDAATSTGTAPSAEDKLNSIDHTVYVEGIPFDCQEAEVKSFFIDNGCKDVLQLRLPTWQDSGRLRGFGHVVFDTTESRNKALEELNGKHLKKRYLNIQTPKDRGGGGSNAQPRDQPEGCRTIFVRNMPYRGIDEKDVEEVFRSCGKIVEGGVRLTRNYQTKELKGFGYVEFKNPEGAYSAVQRAAKGGLLLKGRPCKVDYEEGKMKGSFRNADGKNWQKAHGSVYEERGDPKRIRR